MYERYNVNELSMLNKYIKQEELPSSILYNTPFNVIPGAPGQYIPSYEKIDYPNAPIELLPSARKKKITSNNVNLNKLRNKKKI